MGCDIHIWVERKENGKWIEFKEDVFTDDLNQSKKINTPFSDRSYGLFAFFANVRNYSKTVSLQEYRGLPKDSEYLNKVSKYAYQNNPLTGKAIPIEEQTTNYSDINDDQNYHSHGWLLLNEIVNFDYDTQFEDRRQIGHYSNNDKSLVMVGGNKTVEIGKGFQTTYKEFLGELFFKQIEELKTISNSNDLDDVRIVFYFDN